MDDKINIPVFYVSEFNKTIKNVIESNFDYVRIRGEISEVKPATKGQIYLTLKDENSVLSGVIWESKKKYLQFSPEIGMEVITTGKISTWSRFKTTYQIDIDKIEIAGEGALLKLIEERKKRLKEKGFFDQKNKKNIPYLPSKIGVITSPKGSVIYDIINKLKERFPIKVDLWPVAVQGSEAANLIINALRGFNSSYYQNKPDVIIIARGGGSTEDLMAFNDENLAVEIHKSNIPIISAIGHETDTTILDFVSDYRASTPTAAAEAAVPIRKELENNILGLSERLNYFVENNLKKTRDLLINFARLLKAPNYVLYSYKQRLEVVASLLNKEMISIKEKKLITLNNLSRIIQPPYTVVKTRKNELKKLKSNLEKKIEISFNNQKKIFVKLIRLLNSNSIHSNLKKGYVLLSKSKKILKKSGQLKQKDNIKIKFYDKTVGVNIKKIN